MKRSENEMAVTIDVMITTANVASELEPSTRIIGATWSRSICSAMLYGAENSL